MTVVTELLAQAAAGRPWVIAELSANHDGSLDRALATIDAIAGTGAQTVKFQTYTAESMTLDSDQPAFRVTDDHGLWGGRGLFDLYREAGTPYEWHQELFDRARSHGLTPFSSPFDGSAIELLEGVGCEIYKIASAELLDLPLIRLAASTGKPLVISTGMASLGEIDAALSAARSGGSGEVVLLSCTAAYPADPGQSHLANIAVLREAFGVPVGLSDHTPGIGVPVAAVALGAVAVEKHVTLDRDGGGVDSAFSLEVDELAALVRECAAARAAVSAGPSFGVRPGEEETARFRRSLWVTRDVAAGETVGPGTVRALRPAGGLPPGTWDDVVGRPFARPVRRGTPLGWDLLDAPVRP
ncbi:pseudaminic acid synthase [Modestobacter roseus]|uniref:N-acetylneuraminate synthase n=1 Tax=Modestobacter roseus TaxID=1181884 RepID=A0A562ITZ0_9ACTN|nr:pseudaminic acid synthase [Modestobacter roseus]MQA33296.1 pseudaminic acid synthase [Modestobacter roseus]TWH74223.1 N-acetylneuraminate synthase [Modestobacter roseus]